MRDVADGVSQTWKQAEQAAGDVGRGLGDAYGEADQAFQRGDVAGVLDAGAGSMDEWFGGAKQDVNTDVTDDLTKSGGLFSETRDDKSGLLPGEVAGIDLSEKGFRRASKDVNDFKKEFDKNEDLTIAGSDVPERVLTGAAEAGVDLLNLPQYVVTGETAIETSQNAPGAMIEHGPSAVTGTAWGVASGAADAMATDASENPIEFVSGLGFDMVAGFGTGKAVETAADAGRSARMAAKTDDTFDIGQVSTDEAATGDLPNFDTSPNAPTDQAVGEIKQKAEGATPDAVRESLGGKPALYHGTSNGKFGSDIDVAEGGSELPGLWASPQLSPLRLGDSPGSVGLPSSLGDLKPRPPRLRGADEQVVAAPGDAIEAMPDEAAGFGRIPDGEGGYQPDPATSGYQFLDEQADPGKAYVRPPGSRTTELEAIYAPGTRFTQAPETFGVNYGGRTIELQPYNRVDQQEIEATTGKTGQDAIDAYEEQTGQSVTSSAPTSYVDDRSGAPFAPVPFVGGTPPIDSSSVAPAQEGSPESNLFTTGPDDVGAAPDGPSNYYDPYNGGSLFSEPSSHHVLDVDESVFGTSTYDGPDGSTSPGPSSSAPSSSPSYGPGPEWSSGGFSGDGGVSSPGESTSGGSPGPTSPPPISEFGPAFSPPASPPSGGPGSSSPGSPPASGPPTFSPPGSYGGGGSSPPGYGGSPSGSPTFGGPSPFDPGPSQRSDLDDDRKKDDEEYGYWGTSPYAIEFTNPIASGAEVLFGGSGFGVGFRSVLDETGGLQEGGADISETATGGPVDEAGGFENWTPF